MQADPIRKNAFDVVRIFAAVNVMLHHFNSFFPYPSSSPLRLAYLQLVNMYNGVVILFSLSGFLVAASLERSPSRGEFFQKRFLRIYPPLWLCTAINVIALLSSGGGQIVWDKSMLRWACVQLLGIAYTPEQLSHFATGSANGALWTVLTEIQLYVVLAFSYRILKKLKPLGWGLVGFLLLLCNLGAGFLQGKGGVIAAIVGRLFLPYALWFFIGVFLYRYREHWIPWLTDHSHKKYLWLLLLLFTLYKFIPVQMPGYFVDIISSVCLPVLTVGLAYQLGEIHIKPDLSYQLVLYHWIVLNVMISLGCFQSWDLALALAIYFAATIALSLLGYYLSDYLTGLLRRLLSKAASRLAR